MNILVTGGAGFIGSAVVTKLLQRGDTVTVLDNLTNGGSVPDDATLVEADIRDTEALQNLPAFDVVVHLAALLDVHESCNKPKRYADVNVNGTMQLLRHVTTKKFINASSAAVYGDVETVPVEEDQVLQPTTPYGATKAGAEAYVTTYHDLKDIDVASLRFFNAYGPGQRPDSSYAGVISIFIDQFLNDERPVIYGDGEQTRDFIFVDDVAEAVVHACDASIDHEIMNIATGTETSVNAIVENLQALTGKDLEPRYEAARSSDIRRSVADTSKAEKLLDFTASTPFKDGLQTTLEWMQDRA